MPRPAPFLTAGSREPRRPTRIPPAVRRAIQHLVGGHPETGAQLGFIEAGKLEGNRPDTMRRWMYEPSVRALIKAQRAALLDVICAPNPLALAAIRDRPDGNDAAKVRAVVALEEMAAADDSQSEPGQASAQSFVINIVERPSVTIEGRSSGPFLAPREARSPAPPAALEPIEELKLPPSPNPIFKVWP